jgi:enoyl-[acyl-carrier protein] reductase III
MSSMLDATEKYWEHTMRTNAFGFLALVQHAAPLLAAAAESRIIAVSSPGASRVTPNYGLVGVSKAALEALVRFLAMELAPLGIVVNAVSPGLLDTSATHFLPDADAMLARVDAQTPAGRLATVEDVADVVSLLCSPHAKMIVGQTIVVDGGYGLLYSPAPSLPAAEDE